MYRYNHRLVIILKIHISKYTTCSTCSQHEMNLHARIKKSFPEGSDGYLSFREGGGVRIRCIFSIILIICNFKKFEFSKGGGPKHPPDPPPPARPPLWNIVYINVWRDSWMSELLWTMYSVNHSNMQSLGYVRDKWHGFILWYMYLLCPE